MARRFGPGAGAGVVDRQGRQVGASTAPAHARRAFPPRRAQLSALDRIAKTYASAGLTVIGVNVDDDVARAEKFARSQDVQFQLLISTPENTGRDYQVDRVPMTVFVDREGVLRVAHREFKARDEETYVRELRALLNE